MSSRTLTEEKNEISVKARDKAGTLCYNRQQGNLPEKNTGTLSKEIERPMSMRKTRKHRVNQSSYFACVEDLITSEQVESMKQWRHHFSVTTYDHSLFVSYVAFRLARRLGRDYRMAARMGLLHDLYLYDSHDKSAHPGNQCFDHPVAAARNAAQLVELSAKEENIILSHMWPLAKTMPRSAEALIVNAADKFCATLEVSYVSRMERVQRWIPRIVGPELAWNAG